MLHGRENEDLQFLGGSYWVCQNKIFIVLCVGSEHVFPLGERSALSFGEVCGQSGIFMVWDSSGDLLIHSLPLWRSQ